MALFFTYCQQFYIVVMVYWTYFILNMLRYLLCQLSFLPSVGQEMSTGQSAMTLCGWGVKVGMAHPTCG